MKKLQSFRTAHELMVRRLLMCTSIVLGIAIWKLVSEIPGLNTVIVGPVEVGKALIKELFHGRLMNDISVSMTRVFSGFGLAFITALPVAFLMAWYDIVRVIMEPWLQFFRTIFN
ncbi:MAG: hypothetical protein KH366_19965 [Clostridiaceae bacterium]|nr:hypothetical protein [Clostridiaceae bacterium]